MRGKLTAALALLAAFSISGCSGSQMADLYDNEKEISSDSNSFNLDGIQQNIEEEKWTASVERLEGMDTVWSWEAQETTEAEFSYEITLYSGKLKVVLIDPEGALTTLAECDSPGEQNAQESISLEKGESRIKLVAGEDTRFDIQLEMTEGSFTELGF